MAADPKDLITIARAKQSIRAITDTTYDTILQVWVTAVSVWIEKWLKRTIYSKSFDELYNGSGDARLLLREYPLQLVTSVRYAPQTVLKIQNTTTSTHQRATVRITSSGLTLIRVASGSVTTTTSVTWSGNATLTAVAAAVVALGNGWTAQVVGDFGLWPSADLYVAPSFGDGVSSMGSLNARGVWAEIRLHTSELAHFEWDPRGWLIRSVPYTDPEIESENVVWPAGLNNFRVQYTAGYTTVPEAIQEAASRWVADIWYQSNRDPNATGSGSGTDFAGYASEHPPEPVMLLLRPYRRRTVAIGSG